MAINIQSYRHGAYLLVVGPTGRTIVHFGADIGPIVHTADTLGRALVWVEDARREDDLDHRGIA